MIGARRVTRRRPYASVFLFDEFFIAQPLVTVVAPKRLSDSLMHMFSKSLCQSVGKRFKHNAGVVVATAFIFARSIFYAMARSYNESTKVVISP